MPSTRCRDNVPPPELGYMPSPAVIRLIGEIANAPTLELRVWAAATLMMTMTRIVGPESLAEHKAMVAVAEVLATRDAPARAGLALGASWEAAVDTPDTAELLSDVMKVDDVGARHVALEALVIACADGDESAVAVACAAVRSFIDRVDQENRTRH